MGAETASRERIREFAATLRVARARAEMSQEALAERVGIAPTTISGWERGIRADTPPPSIVYNLEDALGVKNGALALAAGYLPRDRRHPSEVDITELQNERVFSYSIGGPRERRQVRRRIAIPDELGDDAVAFIRFVVDYLAANARPRQEEDWY